MAIKKKDVTPNTEASETAKTDETAPVYPAAWQERVGAFADKVGKSLGVVTIALRPIVGEAGDEALGYLADETAAPTAEIREKLAGLNIPSAKFNAHVGILRGPKVKVEASPEASVARGPSLDILPAVPDDDSFLAMLKVGGELKIGQTEIISALKAALAERVGLFHLPEVLRDRMESFAEQNDEPCGEAYYKLRKMVTQRNYAEVLSVLGVEGQFVNASRKKKLLDRLEEYLWVALHDFQSQLMNWQRSWMDGAANPALMMAAFTAAVGGGGQMPPGMMSPPDTSVLRDAAESVIDKINKAFAGTGIPVSRALAYDAQTIKNVMQDERLPALVGAATKEQMLKMLGVDVAADYVRMERNLVRYALSVMELPKVDGGNSELVYLGAMVQLGLSIPWDKLLRGGTKPAPAKKNFQRFNEDE
ncbi:MAG: hypothetical protein V1867_02825 [Candidatus Falkowbacteria bacterium]